MIQADYGKVSICELSEGKGLKCTTKNNSEKKYLSKLFSYWIECFRIYTRTFVRHQKIRKMVMAEKILITSTCIEILETLKLASAIFYQIFVFHQMIVLQEL